MNITDTRGRTFRLLDREQGDVLIRAGVEVVMYYTRTNTFRPVRVREIKNVARGKRMWPTTERSLRNHTMWFAVEVE